MDVPCVKLNRFVVQRNHHHIGNRLQVHRKRKEKGREGTKRKEKKREKRREKEAKNARLQTPGSHRRAGTAMVLSLRLGPWSRGCGSKARSPHLLVSLAQLPGVTTHPA